MIGFESCPLFLFLLSSFFSFHLLFSSLCGRCVVSCCGVCCCVLCVLCVELCWVWVGEWVGGGGGVYASNTSQCDTLKRLLCAHSKRPRVYRHHVHMFKTCGPVAGTHRDVLNVQGVSACHMRTCLMHTPLVAPPPTHPPSNTTQHTTHTTHNTHNKHNHTQPHTTTHTHSNNTEHATHKQREEEKRLKRREEEMKEKRVFSQSHIFCEPVQHYYQLPVFILRQSF